jgi:hypothetical protein
VSPIAERRSRHTVDGWDPEKGVVDIMWLERVPSETGAILYDPQRLAHPNALHFDPGGGEVAGTAVRAARGRGSAWFLDPLESGGLRSR